MFESPMHFYIHHYGTDQDLTLITQSAYDTQAAIAALESGDVESAQQLWKGVDGKALLDTWNAQINRFKKVGKTWKERRAIVKGDISPAVTEPLARKIYELDNYRCGYCSLPVFTKWPGSPILRLIETFPAMTPDLRIVDGRLKGSGKNGALKNSDYSKFLWSLAACDHVVPRSRGGVTDESNLVTSCSGCNYSKGDLTLDQLGVHIELTR